MKTINLPSRRKDEIEYILSDEEIDTLANLSGVAVSKVMILVEYRYLKEEKEIELYEFSAYAAFTEHRKMWIKIPKELVDGVTFLLDEEKVKELTLESYGDGIEKMKEGYAAIIVEERRGLL